MKKSPPPSKQTATPRDLLEFLEAAYAKKYPHLPPLDSHLKDLKEQAEKEKDLH